MRAAIVLIGLGLMAAGTVQAELPVGLTIGLTLTHDSVERTYDVLRPDGVGDVTPALLVVDLHGFGSNSLQQRGISGFSGLSALEGFVVAWPNGIDSSWNGITCCGTGVSANVDDVGFIRAMVAEIISEANIDVRRIYVTGLSNGGAMSHRLACEAADLFAAAAPMAFPIPYPDFPAQCNPSRLIPVLTFMGLTDTVVSYAGAALTLAGWRDKDGCDSGGAAVEINEVYGGSDCAIDTSCGEPDLETGLCSVTGISFAPPLDVLDGHLLYFNEDGFDITQRAWDFMSRYHTGVCLGGEPSICGPVGGQSKEQQKCINALNKNFAKVAKVQGKDICDCIKDYAKGKSLEPAITLEGCLTEDRKGKVAKAKGKTVEAYNKKCPGLPDFGPTDPNTVNSLAMQKELDLLDAVFGSDLDAIELEVDDKATSKCQQGVLKAVKKCQDAKLKAFNSCKKIGLKDQTIESFIDLQGCMGDDAKGKIAKGCDPASGKIRSTINKKCGAPVNTSTAFPGCGTSAPLALAACLDRMVECHVCLALNEADNLARDCDDFDDGVVNGSCS